MDIKNIQVFHFALSLSRKIFWLILWFMWDKLGWLNWFWQFFSEGLSYFNFKGFSYSSAWFCSVCEGRTSFCTGLTSRELCRFLLMFSINFASLSVLLLFPQLITFFIFMHIFDAILSRIDEVLSINPSANMFVFGDFNVHHKDWLTYSGGTDRLGELWKWPYSDG